MIKVSKVLFSILFLFILFFSAQNVFAADLNLSPSSGTYKVGDTITVKILLSTGGESANAVSGSLKFSQDILSLNSVSKSGSLITLWAQEPTYSNSLGTIDMEGVILSGYTGSSGTVATLSFKAKSTGSANIKFNSSSVLANDGQGTNIISKSGQANFTINTAPVKETPPVTAPAPVVEKDKPAPSIQIEELKKKDSVDSVTKFLISSTGKKKNSNYRISIDDVSYPWESQSSGIYEAPALPKGSHTLKVSMDTINNDVVSNTDSFNISGLITPSFTEYSENIKEKEYIVVKGLADPSIDVYMDVSAVLNNSTSSLGEVDNVLNNTYKIKADDKGVFTYVSDKANSGVYEITAYSKTKGGTESSKSESIKVNVLKSDTIVNNVVNTFSLLIPMVAVIIMLIFISTWGWYKVLHYREDMRKRLAHAKSMVNKSFSILEEDAEEQMKILKKIKALQPLAPDERAFITQFKKDIEAAEEVISNEIKEV